MESFAFVLVLECLGWPGALALAPTGRNWAAVLAEEIRRAARRRYVPLPASTTPGELLRAFYRRTGLADLTNCRTASTMERYEEGAQVCVWGVSGRWADEAAAFLSRGTAAWDRLPEAVGWLHAAADREEWRHTRSYAAVGPPGYELLVERWTVEVCFENFWVQLSQQETMMLRDDHFNDFSDSSET